MRVVVLSYESLYSSLIIAHLLRARPGQVVGIVLSSCLIQGKTLTGSLLYLLKRAGLPFVIQKTVETLEYKGASALWRLLGRPRKVLSIAELAARHGVPIIYSGDVNRPMSFAWIAALEPDLIASVYLNQRIGEPLIQLAPKGCINIHPALLPRHRGLFPYFWVLAANERETGVTVHFVEKAFDTGPIIAQERLTVSPNETIQSLSYRSAVIGGPLLVRAMDAIASGNPPSRSQVETQATYHSWPTGADYRRFRQTGHRWGSLFELLSYL